MNAKLRQLYDATAEDLLFGIGILLTPECKPAPYIHVHYRGWSKAKLEAVRETFHAGIILVHAAGKGNTHTIFLGTREKAVIQCEEGGEKSVLRGPAWNAHLEAVEDRAFRQFEQQRSAFGGYLLLLQTPQWEYLTGVDQRTGHALVGMILPREMDMPPPSCVQT